MEVSFRHIGAGLVTWVFTDERRITVSTRDTCEQVLRTAKNVMMPVASFSRTGLVSWEAYPIQAQLDPKSL